MNKKVLNIKGMQCTGCENRVKNVLGTIDGIEEVVADFKTGIVEITSKHDISANLIKEKIEDLGFEVIWKK